MLQVRGLRVKARSEVEFSVVIPCHNYGRFLFESLGSVLAQEDVSLEIIVVNDGSTDDTGNILDDIADPRLKSIHTKHRGIGAARNTGLTHASGEFIAFLDADDKWRYDRLKRAREMIFTHSNKPLVFAMVQEFLDSSIQSTRDNIPRVRRLRGYSASACVMTRSVWETVGGFDESLESGEFIDWYIRAERHGFLTIVDPEVLVFRRIHQDNRDRQFRESSKEYARILMRKIRAQGVDQNEERTGATRDGNRKRIP